LVKTAPVNWWTGFPNRFIRRGEYYFAGNLDYNPWGPVYSGDFGLVTTAVVQSSDEEIEAGVFGWNQIAEKIVRRLFMHFRMIL
jgi:hypothetical protein